MGEVAIKNKRGENDNYLIVISTEKKTKAGEGDVKYPVGVGVEILESGQGVPQ